MGYVINLSEELLDKEIRDFKKIEMTKEQNTIIEETSRLVAEFLEVSEIAIKSSSWKACKEWQLKNNKKITDIVKMSQADRIFAIKELFNICKKYLIELLLDHEEQDFLIDIAFDRAYKLYLSQVV